MNNIQEHLVKLLGEIDELCISNQIPYLLYGRTARDAFTAGEFIGSYVYANVMIPADAFERFEALVQKRYAGQRALEWIANNPAFPGLHMRYVDLNTTFIYGDSVQKYNNPGIYVSIERARLIPSNRLAAKLANGIDKAIEYSSIDDLSGLGRAKRTAVSLVRGFMKLFGREKTLRRMLRFQNRLCKRNTGRMAVIHYLADNTDLSAEHFSKVVRVPLEKRTFQISANTAAFLSRVFGNSWKDNAPAEISAPHLLASSTEVPFRDVLDDESRAELSKIGGVMAERQRIQNEMKPLDAKIHRYWAYLFVTGSRFDLFRKYYPHRGELTARFQNGEYDVLRKLLAEVLELETKYIDEGLAMPVFPELDEIILALYEYAGDYQHAEPMKKRSTKFKPVTLALDGDSLPPDNEAWPMFLRTAKDGSLAVSAYDPDGKEYPVVFRSYHHRRLAPLHCGGDSVTVIEVGEDAELIALDGERELSMAELFNLCRPDEPFLRLYHRLYDGRCCELCCLLERGELIPTAELQDSCYCGVRALPALPVLGADRGLNCCLYDGRKVLGPVLLQDAGALLPVVKLGLDGVLRPTEKKDARLMYRKADGSLAELGEALAPGASLVSVSSYGVPIKVAELDGDAAIRPLVRLGADGAFEPLNDTEVPFYEQFPSVLRYDFSDNVPAYLDEAGRKYTVVYNSDDSANVNLFVLSARQQ